MLVHSVFFWLKPDLTAAQKAAFVAGVTSLTTLKGVRHGWIGTPAATPKRPVIDGSYSYALTVVFDDVAGHDAYQVDPAHLKFVDECKQYWSRVQVYDAQ